MTIGRQPQQGQGYGMPDFVWLLGMAGGNNRLVQSGVVALAGGAQAAAPVVGAPNSQGLEAMFVMVETVVTAADSIQLPNAINGKMLLIQNRTANACAVFANAAINKATGIADVINALANGTALSVPAGKIGMFFCAKDGFWAGSPLP